VWIVLLMNCFVYLIWVSQQEQQRQYFTDSAYKGVYLLRVY
jgi:hypothetical protein